MFLHVVGVEVAQDAAQGDQAIQGTAYGTTKLVKGQLTFTNVKSYPPERVNPPEGVKSSDWIKSGFKK